MDRTQDSGSCNLGSTPSWRIHQEVQVLSLFFCTHKNKKLLGAKSIRIFYMHKYCTRFIKRIKAFDENVLLR